MLGLLLPLCCTSCTPPMRMADRPLRAACWGGFYPPSSNVPSLRPYSALPPAGTPRGPAAQRRGPAARPRHAAGVCGIAQGRPILSIGLAKPIFMWGMGRGVGQRSAGSRRGPEERPLHRRNLCALERGRRAPRAVPYIYTIRREPVTSLYVAAALGNTTLRF